jgi:tetratricopeptide (TPR) repeat protein
MPFDLTTSLGSNLKEKARDKEQFELARNYILDEIKASDDLSTSELRDRYSILGYICRILNLTDESIQYAQKAFELSKKLNMILLVVVDQVRLASSYQYAGNFDTADDMFKDAIDVCENYQPLDEVIDFAYQNFAKCLFEQGKYLESKLYFEKALNVREEKGIEELKASTQFALDIVNSIFHTH